MLRKTLLLVMSLMLINCACNNAQKTSSETANKAQAKARPSASDKID